MSLSSPLSNKVVIVTGGSRGLGRGVVEALSAKGARVVALSRSRDSLAALARDVTGVATVTGDAADEALVEKTFEEHAPDCIVLCAGAIPPIAPLQEQTWATFEVNWNVDTKSAFVWLRQALRRPMKRGGHIIVVSSGAALQGSPASGGYASAKRAQWYLADYAANESGRAELGLRVHCVLPSLNPNTALGLAGVAAYAARAGVTPEVFAQRLQPALTPEGMGRSVAELLESPERFTQLAYRVGGAGLAPLG